MLNIRFPSPPVKRSEGRLGPLDNLFHSALAFPADLCTWIAGTWICIIIGCLRRMCGHFLSIFMSININGMLIKMNDAFANFYIFWWHMWHICCCLLTRLNHLSPFIGSLHIVCRHRYGTIHHSRQPLLKHHTTSIHWREWLISYRKVLQC